MAIKKYTARTILYKTIAEKLKEVCKLELVDIDRNQWQDPNEPLTGLYTMALIAIGRIDYQSMSGKAQEGKVSINIKLYVLDGFADQQMNTEDNIHGLAEMQLMDDVVDALQFLKGDGFAPLEQNAEESLESPMPGVMAYQLTFETWINQNPKKTSKYVSN